jgi:hypothetical protein
MKYRVTIAGKSISDPDRNIIVPCAVSAINAKEIAKMRYKREPLQAVRLGTQPSTVRTMNELRTEFIEAKDAGNKEIASRAQKAFYSTMASLQAEMDVVAFNMAKQYLPDLPPMGK